jgi:hypothetical protein
MYLRTMLSKIDYCCLLIELQDECQGGGGYSTSSFENGASFQLPCNAVLSISLHWLFSFSKKLLELTEGKSNCLKCLLQDTNSRLALLSVEVSVTFDTRIWEDSS